MVSLLVVCVGLLGAVSPEVAREYQRASAEVGRDADAHVRLALWCEAHGLEAERLKHLALAVLCNPAHTTARGLLGLVAYRDQWQPPDLVAAKVQADEVLAASLAEYNARRAKTPDTADAHWELALWCEGRGLKAEAVAHLTAVTRLDPSRTAAWKRLGCQKHHGRWMTPAQIAAEIAESEAQRLASRHWQSQLERWRTWLGSPDEGKRAEAKELLAGVSDPRAVPVVWRVFGKGGPELQSLAIRLLGQIQAPAASRALAMLAISAGSNGLRQDARDTLTRGDPRDYAGVLVEILRDPIRYRVKPVEGPGKAGALEIERDRFTLQRVYAPPPLPKVQLSANDSIQYDPFGLPVIVRVTGTTEVRVPGNRLLEIRNKQTEIPIGRMIAESYRSARVAEWQLETDAQRITSYNDRVVAINGRAVEMLEEATGQGFSADEPEAWRAWWNDEQGYSTLTTSTDAKPTIVQNVSLAYTPQSQAVATVGGVVGYRSHSCFGAGTAVQTLAGARPIEAIRIGDQVLTQDVGSGALGYEPVVAVHHNPPQSTLRLTLGEDSVIVTPIHRFWRAGRGWAMARDLKPGDSVRTLGGAVKVKAVSEDRVQRVFNLEVARGRSFFVGQGGMLVHDNSLVEPTPNPFDAPPALTAIVKDAR